MINIYDYRKAKKQIEEQWEINKNDLCNLGTVRIKREGDFVHPEIIYSTYWQYRRNLKKKRNLP